MKIIDLSHLIHSDMPVYPGTESPFLQQVHTLIDEIFKETKITMYSHTGTHIDAPWYMVPDGLSLNNMNINHFFGKATILNFYSHKKLFISLNDLVLYQEKISKVDFVMIKNTESR